MELLLNSLHYHCKSCVMKLMTNYLTHGKFYFYFCIVFIYDISKRFKINLIMWDMIKIFDINSSKKQMQCMLLYVDTHWDCRYKYLQI